MRPREDPTQVALGLVATAMAAVSGYFYRGPYAWLAELQLVLFYAHVVQLTFVLTVIACWVPLGLARRAWSRRELDGRGAGSWAPVSRWGERWHAVTDAAEVSPRAFQAAIGGIVLLVIAAWLGVDGLTAGTLHEVDVASLEAGEAPESRYVDLVGGSFLADRASAYRSGRSLRFYVPYVSEGGALTVFVELSEHEQEFALAGPLRGVLQANGLPGPVRVDLEAQGEIGDVHWVLEYGEEPGETTTLAAWLLGIGLLLLGLGALFLRGSRYR